jgi:hypothetical protein
MKIAIVAVVIACLSAACVDGDDASPDATPAAPDATAAPDAAAVGWDASPSVDADRSLLGAPCVKHDDCKLDSLHCAHLVGGDICTMKCDSQSDCHALGGECSWEGAEYSDGHGGTAVVEIYLCMPT